ncbi:hypothetical protein [Sedimentitalea nanhaiensis]|uniref:Sulfotransferase family protein n=1 Tax=Sedimentitalea nanhaiensis TaxID=999627 RepID=A0A1I6Y4C5_9RHOB|nr:hypothetical protein [Sedimentitalea nanhaiensis]SFT45348.1 hypothetical protein SAMN05216236_10259 [Sedimentitalea nanhaiensis]
MQVIIHAGAHCTDDDRLLKTLLRNKQDFSRYGIAVPGPGKYRDLLAHSFRAMEVSEPAPDAREILLDAFLDDEIADRLILSNAFFFGSKRQALYDGRLYPTAPARIVYLRKLFPEDRLNVFMALRNPAGFLPALLGPTTPQQMFDIMGRQDPRHLRWSELLNRIRIAAPDVGLTVWCNEDTPLIWAAIIREMAGLEPGQKITGGFDLLSTLMSGEGMQKFRAYLHKHPRLDESRKRDVIAAFLEEFALEDELEEELDLPGWTEDLVQELTEIYDADVTHIQNMPGITMIAP